MATQLQPKSARVARLVTPQLVLELQNPKRDPMLSTQLITEKVTAQTCRSNVQAVDSILGWTKLASLPVTQQNLQTVNTSLVWCMVYYRLF